MRETSASWGLAETAMPSTNCGEDIAEKGFGSSGRTRTYNPSVNSTTGCSRLTLQTQDLDARKTSLSGIWGDSGGTLTGGFRSLPAFLLIRAIDW